MAALHLPVILGTVREGRRSEWVARYVLDRLAKRAHATTRLIDPREWPFGNLVAREWEMEPQPARVAEFVHEMARADGFVLVCPEYNHGYPGALKNMIDALEDEWARKAFAIVSVGGVSGGLRATEQLRLVIGGLNAVCVPRSVPIQSIGKTWNEHGPLADAEAWAKRVDGLLDELAWYAGALKAARASPSSMP